MTKELHKEINYFNKENPSNINYPFVSKHVINNVEAVAG